MVIEFPHLVKLNGRETLSLVRPAMDFPHVPRIGEHVTAGGETFVVADVITPLDQTYPELTIKLASCTIEHQGDLSDEPV